MRILTNPVAGYVGAVLGVIAVASFAVFNLHGMAATAHRHWDADIDRIIAQQLAKKQDAAQDAAMAAAFAPVAIAEGEKSDVRPTAAAFTSDSLDQDEDPVTQAKGAVTKNDDAGKDEAGSHPRKAHNQNGKKAHRRADRRRQHYIPAVLATLPKFAATAAATTTTLLRLR